MAAAWMVEQRGKNEEKQCGSSTRMRRARPKQISMTNLCPGNAESPARGWCGDVVAGDVFTFGAKCPSLRRGQRTAIYSPPPQTTTTCPLPTLTHLR